MDRNGRHISENRLFDALWITPPSAETSVPDSKLVSGMHPKVEAGNPHASATLLNRFGRNCFQQTQSSNIFKSTNAWHHVTPHALWSCELDVPGNRKAGLLHTNKNLPAQSQPNPSWPKKIKRNNATQPIIARYQYIMILRSKCLQGRKWTHE